MKNYCYFSKLLDCDCLPHRFAGCYSSVRGPSSSRTDRRARAPVQRCLAPHMTEQCAICGCPLHRIANSYAQASIAGRSYAIKHHYVARRFFGRPTNAQGELVEGIFSACPWKHERESAIFCYECREELLRNPVLLPEDVSQFAQLVKRRGLGEKQKTESRVPIAGRVVLLHEVISLGIATARKRDAILARKRAVRDLSPLLGGFAAIFLLVGFSPWYGAYSATENVAIEGWLFFLAGLLVCALAPAHPFRAAVQGTVGVFAGTAAGIVVHGIFDGSSERSFFPFEIAAHTGMSAPGFLLSALVWKTGSEPIFWNMSELREVVDARIAAALAKLLDSMRVDIETLKSKNTGNGSLGAARTIDGVLAICTNALYALAEAVVTQYDAVLGESLVISPFAVEKMVRAVPDQLRPLLEQCLAHVRREANLARMSNAAPDCIASLESKFDAISRDVALTLRASCSERNQSLARKLARPLLRLLESLVAALRPSTADGARRFPTSAGGVSENLTS